LDKKRGRPSNEATQFELLNVSVDLRKCCGQPTNQVPTTWLTSIIHYALKQTNSLTLILLMWRIGWAH